MNDKIKEFLQKLAQDEQLYAKFETCKTPEEAYAVASGAEGGFTKEEFIAAMTELNAANNDLNDGDLILSGFPSISIETIRSGRTSSRMSRAVRSLTARSWRGTSRTARNSTVMLIRRISKTRFIGAWTMLDASRD